MSGSQTFELDLGAFSKYSLFSVHGEDAATVLTSHITFIALLVSAAFLSGVQLIGEPIECWCPAMTTDSMCNYTKSVCWISRQYVIDFGDEIPRDPNMRSEAMKREMSFYPMVPFILLMVAFAIRLPNFIKDSFQGEEGLNIPKAVRLAHNIDRNDEESGKEVADEMLFNLTRRAPARSRGDSALWTSVKSTATALGPLFLLGGDLGTYQTGLFLLARLTTVLVLVAIFPFLGYALQINFTAWGWDLLRWVALDGVEPFDYLQDIFPRETLCDFRVRQMQNVHQYTVQCVLPINMWSEKVFLVLWFWLLFLVLANIFSYQYWFRKLLFAHHRRHLVSKHIKIRSPTLAKKERKNITDFALNYLNHDSILVLRVLEMSAGNRFANVVVGLLWKDFNNLRPDIEERREWPENPLIGPD